MLSGLAFSRDRSESPGPSNEQEKKAKEKSKRKHKSKKKSHKLKRQGDVTEHGSPEPPQRSESPQVSDGNLASGAAGSPKDSIPTDRNDQQSKEWDSLLNRVSDKPRHQDAQKHACEAQKETVSQAPRLDNTAVAGRGSGRVGDGGSGWRRRLQMRQSGEEGGMPERRDVSHSDGHWHKSRGQFSRSKHEGMKKPRTDAATAFTKHRHPARDVERCDAPAGQPEQHRDRRPRADTEDGTRSALHSKLSDYQAGTVASSGPPASATGRANLSAAAQLRARLRGEPAAELATSHRDTSDRRPTPPAAHERRRHKMTEEDEEHLSAAALAKSTRLGHGMDDIDKAFARNITSKRKFKMSDMDPDDEHDFGVGVDLHAKKKKPQQPEVQARKQTQPMRGPQDHVASRCNLCFMSDKRNKHITLSIGSAAYLALPARGSLVPGHCTIIPVEHVSCMRAADTEVAEEVKNFKKCLIQMFQAQDKRCIFMETATHVKQSRSHACVECVPVSQEAFSSAPMILKREIDVAESEWSQHHAKRFIETTDRGLNNCIPSNFPYLHVEFGYKKGYVHVIDDEESWDRRFGRSIMASLSGADTVEIYRRAQRDSTTSQTNEKDKFLENWGEFDWTKQLEQTEEQAS